MSGCVVSPWSESRRKLAWRQTHIHPRREYSSKRVNGADVDRGTKYEAIESACARDGRRGGWFEVERSDTASKDRRAGRREASHSVDGDDVIVPREPGALKLDVCQNCVGRRVGDHVAEILLRGGVDVADELLGSRGGIDFNQSARAALGCAVQLVG